MNKKLSLFFIVTMIFTLLLTACGGSSLPGAKESLKNSMTQTSEADSFSFETTFKLQLDLPDEVMVTAEDAMIESMINNSELTLSGVYQKDPQTLQLDVGVAIKGDMSMTINVPMFITEEKMWVKVPSIPSVPIPAELQGQYIELDFKQLEALAASTVPTGPTAFDQALAEEFGKEVGKIISDSFEEDEYFEVMKGEDADVSGLNHAVKFEITNEQLIPTIETLINKALPALLDLAEQDKWAEFLEITSTDVDALRSELEASQADIDTALTEIDNALNIETFEYVNGVDDKGYASYQKLDVNLEITSEGQTGTLGFVVENNITDINKADASITLPSGDEVIPFEEVMGMLMYYGY
jgi:hypothetical protein